MKDPILESTEKYSNPFAVVLAGGVGGARMARALASVLQPRDLTVIVNVGDDDRVYGVHVAADLDTVVYTLAGIEGPRGWGIRGDTFSVMSYLEAIGIDTTFRLGDRDLATCLARTAALDAGSTLSSIVERTARSLGVASRILPASDDPLRTKVRIESGAWLDFQEYFVSRRHRDTVTELRYEGASTAKPAPGVLDVIAGARLVVIAPSNPPLSIWPILAIPGVEDAVRRHPHVVAVSPLFGGKPLKGPADSVMISLGLPPGNEGVLTAYEGLIQHLVIDAADGDDAPRLGGDVAVHTTDTRVLDRASAERFGAWMMETVA